MPRTPKQPKVTRDQQIGMWTVLEDGYSVGKKVHCLCSGCLIEKEVKIQYLLDGRSQGCRSCRSKEKNGTHGHAKDPTWVTWSGMKTRCSNPNRVAWKHYGGRGISYDPRWEKFEHFMEDMGQRPGLEYSLDRIDPDKNYTKANCRWILKSINSSRAASKSRKK